MAISSVSSASSQLQAFFAQQVAKDSDGDNDGSTRASQAAAVKSPASYNAISGASNRIDIMA